VAVQTVFGSSDLTLTTCQLVVVSLPTPDAAAAAARR
jgi:hypothetical protein